MSNSNQKSATMSIVRKHDIKAQKKYGQNFLTDDGVLDEIAEAAGVCDRDHIVEIGPGLGALTKRLAEKASHVTAIEIDTQMMDVENGHAVDVAFRNDAEARNRYHVGLSHAQHPLSSS